MRSSIACSRCRRSKIKCMNNGTNTTCRACATTGRECVYPPPAVGQTVVKRSEPTGISRNEGEADAKRQKKRENESGRKHSVRISDDPFESPQITPKLWKEVYNAFMLHCSAELPFIHEEVFHLRVQQTSAERSPDTQIFLLAMLALTARFIPDLALAYNAADPLVASEYYAEAVSARLDAPALSREPTLERVQSLVMISLYHWGMCRGQSAWMYLTIAKGFAQIMGLMFEEDSLPNRRQSLPSLAEEARKLGVRSKLPDASPRSDEQSLILREIKRRTVYSIFILDRYQASGRFRPQNINIEDLHVQLPCSEEDFRFGVAAVTGSLLDSPKDAPSLPLASTQMLSIFIRLVEIWGRISRWSCKGGRRNEQFPPWHKESSFFKLRSQIEAFDRALPPKLTFSASKTSAHIAGGTITLYTAIHTLYSLCTIVLHREYIPFIPLRCSKPDGPLDEPVFEPGSAPEKFWEDSARLLFKSARDIMEIVRVASDRQALVQSPQVGFAVWTAAFVGIYSINFPYMDQYCFMCDPRPGQEPASSDGVIWKGATALAVSTLNNMKQRSKMARSWSSWIDRMHGYFEGIKRDYDAAIRAFPGPSSEHQKRLAEARGKSLREGGFGGGLEEYKLLERELKDFGPSLDQDQYDSPTPYSKGSARAAHIKQESLAGDHRSSVTDGGWAAVNVATAPQQSALRDEANRANYAGQSARDPTHSTTYYPRTTISGSHPPTVQPGASSTSDTVGDRSSSFQGPNQAGSSYGSSSQPLQQNGPGQYGRQIPPNMEWNRQRSGDQSLKHLEQINMHGGVDVAMFGGSLDTVYWPSHEWPAAANSNSGGGGVNFMEAAGAPSGPYGPPQS